MSKVGRAYKKASELRVGLSSDVTDQTIVTISKDDEDFTLTKDEFKAAYDIFNYENRIIVQSASDLSDIDSTKLYMIDGLIDMGTTPIVVPEGGINIAGLNGGREVMGLYSNENNYTMFTTPSGGYAGNVLMESMTLYVTGTNSKLFNLDNDDNSGSFEFTGMNFGGFGSVFCTSLGSISSYRQFFVATSGIYNVKDGFTMNGTWSGLVFTDSNVLGTDALTLFKEGTDLIFEGSLRSNANFGATAGSLNSSSVFMDFDEDNIQSKGGLSLTNFRTSVDDALPNLPSTSSYVRYKDGAGVRDTYVGGQWTITTQATTTITTAETPVKMAGTTTEVDLQWFTDGGDNRLVYDGEQQIEVECKGVMSISGGSNDQASIFFRQWDSSASTWIDAPKAQATLNGGGAGNRAEGVPFFGYFTLDNADYIEVWIQNDSDTTNVTAIEGGLASIVERAS
jgi:hypothetical protein